MSAIGQETQKDWPIDFVRRNYIPVAVSYLLQIHSFNRAWPSYVWLTIFVFIKSFSDYLRVRQFAKVDCQIPNADQVFTCYGVVVKSDLSAGQCRIQTGKLHVTVAWWNLTWLLVNTVCRQGNGMLINRGAILPESKNVRWNFLSLNILISNTQLTCAVILTTYHW